LYIYIYIYIYIPYIRKPYVRIYYFYTLYGDRLLSVPSGMLLDPFWTSISGHEKI
jgi:hypothetical protein